MMNYLTKGKLGKSGNSTLQGFELKFISFIGWYDIVFIYYQKTGLHICIFSKWTRLKILSRNFYQAQHYKGNASMDEISAML